MAGYVDKVRKDISHWIEHGLIPAEAGPALVADVEARHGRGIGFGQVLAVMAALLFAAAILLVVAANWEAIPRLVRVAALFAMILAGYVGGALAKIRAHDAIAEGAWVIASAAFGASIALISQMYHLTGDEADAILLWCAGVTLAAFVLRSPVQTVCAVALGFVWAVWPVLNYGVAVSLWFPVLLALLWLAALWSQSVPARHLILLALIAHVFMLYLEYKFVFIPVALALAGAALVTTATPRGAPLAGLTGLGEGLAVHGLLAFLVGMLTLQVQFEDKPLMPVLAAITFAGVVGALMVAGRTGRGIRWTAYAGFGAEVVYLYVAMIGSMLGTAGFFVVAAAGLALLAFIVIRVERRLAASSEVPA